MSNEDNAPNDKNKKRLLNEVLPDPERAAAELSAGGPRKRTAEHLKRILTLSLMGAAGTMPHGTEAMPASKPRQERPPFRVVDSLPPPPVPPTPPKPGYLSLKSNPDITIDGKATGLKTPQLIELKPGTHTIKLTAGDFEQTFTVQIQPEQTRSEDRELKPPAEAKEAK
jgi:hypothetical protein